MNAYSQCEECEHPSICNTACLCIKSIPKNNCDCEEPKPNYPEMVWCDKCGLKISTVKYCSCGEEIESENSAVCIDCFNEMIYPD